MNLTRDASGNRPARWAFIGLSGWVWLLLPVIGLGWALLGVYFDREWNEPYLFLKHRPSARLVFHSPVGESDRSAASMSPEAADAERLFKEFVETGGGWRRAIHLSIPRW